MDLGVCAGIAMLGLSGAAYAAPSLAARACPSPELTRAGARCGVVEVPEDPAKPDRKIGLNVVIVPALHPKPGEPPLFHLEGGPGIAATNAALFYAGPGSTYRQSQDVVLVDQGHRGLRAASLRGHREPLATG